MYLQERRVEHDEEGEDFARWHKRARNGKPKRSPFIFIQSTESPDIAVKYPWARFANREKKLAQWSAYYWDLRLKLLWRWRPNIISHLFDGGQFYSCECLDIARIKSHQNESSKHVLCWWTRTIKKKNINVWEHKKIYIHTRKKN